MDSQLSLDRQIEMAPRQEQDQAFIYQIYHQAQEVIFLNKLNNIKHISDKEAFLPKYRLKWHHRQDLQFQEVNKIANLNTN